MIDELSIRDLGVIAEATLPLGPGFTAVTGETGAGKTMVVTALSLLLGARADAGTVRSGSGQAWVEGRWIVPESGIVAHRVTEAGGSLDAGELLISRSVSSEGRSRAIVGGRSAPVAVLGELGDALVVMHGQSEQVRLRSAVAQREALDRFGGADVHDAQARYAEAFSRWRATRSELETLTAERDARIAEADELRLLLEAVEAADPKPGEDVELASRAERLRNIEALRVAAAQAKELVSAEHTDDVPDAIALVDAARRNLERVTTFDSTLTSHVESLTSAGFVLADVAAELAGYLAGLDTDGARELEAVEERRARLNALIRQHGSSLDDVIAFRSNASHRLLELDSDADRIEHLQSDVADAHEQVSALAARLSELRISAARQLESAVTEELHALAMPDARLVITVATSEEFAAHGSDSVEFLLAPHAGAQPRPVARGASGGELSRVMLAIEVVLAASDPVPTFVFDEIDAGVGGAAAIEIGRRLARLAENAQVIVVTHLAQVAAFAGNHLRVVKDTDGSVTASSVHQLSGQERAAEMARLLSGLSDSESGLAHARELMSLAGTS